MNDDFCSVDNRPSHELPCGCIHFPSFFDGSTTYEPFTQECTNCTQDRFSIEAERFRPSIGSFDDSHYDVSDGAFTLTEEDFK